MTCSVPIIAIPSGKCPVKLKGSEYEDVIGWAEEVISIGRSNSSNYLPSALIFFAQQFFNIFSEEYKSVRNHIENHYGTAGNVYDVIEKVNSAPVIQKSVDENGDVVKKRRGRPPKKLYSPSTTFAKPQTEVSSIVKEETKEETKKVRIKRK